MLQARKHGYQFPFKRRTSAFCSSCYFWNSFANHCSILYLFFRRSTCVISMASFMSTCVCCNLIIRSGSIPIPIRSACVCVTVFHSESRSIHNNHEQITFTLWILSFDSVAAVAIIVQCQMSFQIFQFISLLMLIFRTFCALFCM